MDQEQTHEEETEHSEQESGNGSAPEGEGQSDEQQKAQQVEEETEKAKEKVKELEDDPPDDLEDWPDDKSKYETFGGPEGEHSYEEGPEAKLGPSSLRHHEDGSVEIEGEKVDNPEEYKGKPIPGGPTDPDASRMYGEEDLSDEGHATDDYDGDGDGDSDESDDSDKDEDSGEKEESRSD
jgi:hypothetical protein